MDIAWIGFTGCRGIFLPALVGQRAEKGGSTRVLFWNGLLWYRSAIVFEDLIRQYGAVWARFVLITSLLLFCRFSLLLTRHGRRGTVDRI